MAARAIRVYTRHGLRAHYLEPAGWTVITLVRTYCGKPAVVLSQRSRFFRRRLAQASVCSVCEKAEEAL